LQQVYYQNISLKQNRGGFYRKDLQFPYLEKPAPWLCSCNLARQSATTKQTT
jgi:hypothetical protein